MTDRPILFSGPMVRAIIDGRKTQTRRVLKEQPPAGTRAARVLRHPEDGKVVHAHEWRSMHDAYLRDISVPYAPGDRLWVREAHSLVPATAYRMSEGAEQAICPADPDSAAIYRLGFDRSQGGIRWRPSIHMPRWASRLTLTVTDVRVQRLQGISEGDAQAEGLAGLTKDGRLVKWGIPDRDGLPGQDDHGWPWSDWKVSAADAFRDLWNSLNAKRGLGWDANPWVVAVSFTVERRNIDAERAAA